MVECGNKESIIKIQDQARERLGKNYELKIPVMRRPKISVIGMSEEYKSDELELRIRSQNECCESAEVKVLNIRKSGRITDHLMQSLKWIVKPSRKV